MPQKTALIIGGTKGLGLALAHGARERGMRTIRTAREDRGTVLEDSEFRPMDASVPSPAWDTILAEATDPDLTHLFWVAGIWLRGPLSDCTAAELQQQVGLHFSGMMEFVRRFQHARLSIGKPYCLTIIASTSAYKRRMREAVYAATKAGQAAFARQFSGELAEQLSGSRTLLVNPGGMDSGFLKARGVDVTGKMAPSEVSGIVWTQLDGQAEPFIEMNVYQVDGAMRVTYGAERVESQPST